MNQPIVFLDFDGVLNTEQYQARLTMDGKPTKDAWGPLFDPLAVENLRHTLDDIDAQIVISSSWRYAHSLGSLRMMWEVRGLPAPDPCLPQFQGIPSLHRAMGPQWAN